MFRFGANYRVVPNMHPKLAIEGARRDGILSGPAIELLESFLNHQPLSWTEQRAHLFYEILRSPYALVVMEHDDQGPFNVVVIYDEPQASKGRYKYWGVDA